LSSQLRAACPPRRNLHIYQSAASCKQRMLRRRTGTRHRHKGTPQVARPANDLHGNQVHLHPHRLHPQATGKPNTRRHLREINKHIPTTYLAPASRITAQADGSREKQRQQLTTMGRTSVVFVVGTLFGACLLACFALSPWMSTRANMSCLRRRWCFQTRLEGSETLRRTHPPPPACRLLPG